MAYFALAVLVISGAMSLVRQYQMLQQNSYFAKRYFGWISSEKDYISFGIRILLVGLLVWAVVLSGDILKNSLNLFAACSLYFGWKGVAKNSNSIKKLVFTARIKRMLAFSGAVLLALGVCGAVLKGIGGVACMVALVVLATFPELLCLISLFALKPCEKMIAKHYI